MTERHPDALKWLLGDRTFTIRQGELSWGDDVHGLQFACLDGSWDEGADDTDFLCGEMERAWTAKGFDWRVMRFGERYHAWLWPAHDKDDELDEGRLDNNWEIRTTDHAIKLDAYLEANAQLWEMVSSHA